MRAIKGLLPTILVGVMGNSVIYLIPLLVGGMVTDRGFTEQQAGLLASIDLGGYALATALTAYLVGHLNWRHLAFGGLALMVLANAATTTLHAFDTFAAARFVSGLGCGVLAGLASVSLSQTENPERNFGLLLAAALLFGTAGLWGLPVLTAQYGLNSAYWLLASMALAVALVAGRLPEAHAPSAEAGGDSGGVNWLLVGAVLVSVTLFWAEQNAVYAYIERIGNAAGLDPTFIGFSLGMANLTGFAGAALVAWLGTRAGRLLPLAVATVLQLACLLALSGGLSSMAFIVAFGTMSLAWNIVNPFQLGILSGVDPSGKTLALAATVTGIGLAAGPAMGSMAIASGGYGAILWLAAGLAVVSFALLLLPLRRAKMAFSG